MGACDGGNLSPRNAVKPPTLREIKKDLRMFWLQFSLLFKLTYLGKTNMPK